MGFNPDVHKQRVRFYSEGFLPFVFDSKNVAAEFKRGYTSIQGDELSGRLKTATTDEIVTKIHNNCRLKVCQLLDRPPPLHFTRCFWIWKSCLLDGYCIC